MERGELTAAAVAGPIRALYWHATAARGSAQEDGAAVPAYFAPRQRDGPALEPRDLDFSKVDALAAVGVEAPLTRPCSSLAQVVKLDQKQLLCLAERLLGKEGMTMPAASVAKSAPHSNPALALDDLDAKAHLAEKVAHVALAMVLHFYDWDWAGAEREYRRAVELSPGDTFARYNYSFLLAEQGRVELSLTEARSAVERDPIEPTCQFMLAFALVFARRFDAAVAEARSGIEIEPSHGSLHMVLGLGLAGLGRYDEAVGAHRQATKLAPGTDNIQGFLGWALGLAGHPQDAGAILTELKRRGSQRWSPIFGQVVKVESRSDRRNLECHERDGATRLS